MKNNIEQKAINTIRFLAVDAIQKANSGHPGMPMGCAPIAYLLYTKIMKHNPQNSKWVNRDRFILSAGHGSTLLYSLLHLCGYKISMDDLKNFRQWGSITPGHPEYGLTDGVETTTGPLGQGFATAVGMAMAQAFLSAKFNRDEFKIVDHFIYGICGDGDLMEGISHEAASLAGHLKLGKIIFFYDDNGITIDGETSLAFSEDMEKRFLSYGWHVEKINDVNDLMQIERAVLSAQKNEKPSLIITKTHIGYGSPNKQDKESAHGSPLGEEEVKLTKRNLGWEEDKFFFVPDEVAELFSSQKNKFHSFEEDWKKLFELYKTKFPSEAEQFEKLLGGDFGVEWKNHLPKFEDEGKKIATRQASGMVLNSLKKYLPTLIGGSADLAPSNNTFLKDEGTFSASNYSGRNFHFGIREHAMGAILNGMSLYGGVIPYGGTFLVFSDYMRPAIRLAALSHLNPIYVFTHDSIGLGEDGPTHQPIEQLASLRAIPNCVVIRPADANEIAYAWKFAIENKKFPVALVLTRQAVKVIDQKKYSAAENLTKGAYTLYQSNENYELIILASGSEVELALNVATELEKQNMSVRVVSFPSWELFEMQSEEYKNSVLPKNVKKRISIEAGVNIGWSRYTGDEGINVAIDKFGASAPEKILFEKYGFTVENTLTQIIRSFKRS